MDERIEKGTFYLLVANGFSFVANYLVYIILGRFLLGPELLGIYGVVISLVSVIEMIFVKSIQQAVSKLVSEKPMNVKQIRRSALKLQLLLDAVMFAVYFFGAEQFALLLSDISLASYIRLASLLFLLHPIFSVFVGCLNGLKKFRLQAKLRAFYAFSKLVLIIGLTYIGFGLFGAITGFVLASFLGLAAGFFLTRKGKTLKQRFDYRRLALFAAPLLIFSVVADLLITVDLFAVKALSLGNANALSGYYVAASTIAKLFPIFVSTITLVVFPLVSSTTFAGNVKKTRFYIRHAMRYAFLVIAPTAAIFSATSAQLISLVFSNEYLPGATALSILTIALSIYAIFLILETVIVSSNRPKPAMAIALLSFIVSLALNFALVPTFSINGAAIATLVTAATGLVISAAYVFRLFKTLMPLASFARISAVSLVIFLLASFLQFQGLMLILEYLFLLAVYGLALFLSKELGRKDLEVFLNAVR